MLHSVVEFGALLSLWLSYKSNPNPGLRATNPTLWNIATTATEYFSSPTTHFLHLFPGITPVPSSSGIYREGSKLRGMELISTGASRKERQRH